ERVADREQLERAEQDRGQREAALERDERSAALCRGARFGDARRMRAVACPFLLAAVRHAGRIARKMEPWRGLAGSCRSSRARHAGLSDAPTPTRRRPRSPAATTPSSSTM